MTGAEKNNPQSQPKDVAALKKLYLDALIVGAGFSGLYQLHSLRDKLGLNVQVVEAGAGVGGTWYWNRYPGARCDSESHTYCYYFSKELLKEWRWSERYPGQAEILRYLNFCTSKLDLSRSINFNQRVISAIWNEQNKRWVIKTNAGLLIAARYLITAVGCLSSTNMPNISGQSTFKGELYHTGQWPHKGVDFTDKTVVIIGTGSTGIQTIPIVAKHSKHLTVLQRTPNFSVPARNAPLDPSYHEKFCDEINTWQKKMLKSRHGHPWTAPPRKLYKVAKKDRDVILEKAWKTGGLRFRESFNDILIDEQSNKIMSDFIRTKILDTVDDPIIGESLLPVDHPFGTKRPPIDTNYFETFNRDNVDLVDIKQNPIKKFENRGLELEDGRYITADIVIFATGFDAMSGALLKMGIVGHQSLSLDEAWKEGPTTFLGLGVHKFPNLFIITGPGSPSVLTNMPRAIEQHVDWITSLLRYCEAYNIVTVEAEKEAMLNWTSHVTSVANQTLFPKANHSWYLGANIPGKPRTFMPYADGLDKYQSYCVLIAERKYSGFKMMDEKHDQK
ncbi:NAD(P)/FAD-dependent oxidoreductase [Candidatus Puniceispirillum sp.]|nr:NAD(P)/FAD-dependent oxidoreductase [Candidatus Puniceispirillum sp.]